MYSKNKCNYSKIKQTWIGFICLVTLIACTNPAIDDPPVPFVDAPTFDPPAGTYFSSQSVSIYCGTPLSKILFTIDGSDPSSSSEEFTVPISLNTSGTVLVKAIATKQGMNNSSIAEASYSIVIPYLHTITIDGVNDFEDDERFSSSTSLSSGFFAWDSSYLYIGVSDNHLLAGNADDYFLVYIGGQDGTTAGISYNNQTPALPFHAKWHIRRKGNGTYTNVQIFNGTFWHDDFAFSPGDYARQGSFLEMRIPLAQIGLPTTSLKVHLSVVKVTAGNEWTWCGIPASSYIDSYDPNYLKYYDFDLTSFHTPSSYLPIP